MAANKKTSSRLVDLITGLYTSKMAERTGLEPATPGVTGRPFFNREQPTELLSSDSFVNLKYKKTSSRLVVLFTEQ
ncbi:hypothetical protein [Rheinheimera sp. MM224]|uniref:hypothetical protein n=1 Tax=Rheinheimera sp. MM224 TaxID=3019969 RepID=UPI0021F85713|nr:hypothetical protein [Rheinheimera sp. MM224]